MNISAQENPNIEAIQAIDQLAYSVPQAARATSFSEAKIWRLIHAKQLQASKSGGRTLITREALNRYLESLESWKPISERRN
jgi:excisionase family DNA binding protein